MPLTFMNSASTMITSESVTEGHPDKLCDMIADAILDEILTLDPHARVAVEAMATTGTVVVMGELTTECYVDIPQVVRKTIRDIGYTRAKYGFDCETCGVVTSIKEQSPDIALGVDKSRESREGSGEFDEKETLGAGDQGMMVGFACNETPEFMPLPISLAHKLTKQLTKVRKEKTLPYLRPDGKSQVTIEYEYGVPKQVKTVVIAAQHDRVTASKVIEEDIIEKVIRPVVPSSLLGDDTRYLINATGRFIVGGPMGDTGLTGRKILVDTYGSLARHGGGSFSGKDPTKVDRSAAYMARYVAKNLVAAGLADRLELQVAYSIGVARPLSVCAETFGTAHVDEGLIHDSIHKYFDFRPGAIIETLQLRRPIYKATAAYGHFGRDDIDAPWERLDKVEILKKEAGL